MTNKQKILKRMKNVIKGQAMIVRDDTRITQEEKIEQLGEVADIYEMVLRKEYEEERRMNISNLKKEIEEQTRNGRTQVYIKVEDLKILTDKKEISKEGRIYLDIDYVKELIDTYEYKKCSKNKDEEIER